MRALVTGGCGFLGRRVVELLCARGDDVRVIARRRDKALEALGASFAVADVRDTDAVVSAVAGRDVVFHVAGLTGYWGRREDFRSVNVDGTRSVLDAARRCGVPRLIFTSTPSVVGYARDVENGGSGLPYADRPASAYASSKAAAERLVLAANGNGLATVALRPHLIIGPGDRKMLPRVVQRAARGVLRVVGDGKNRVDLTYVDNAAWAHLDAADTLELGDSTCAGRAYFISNGEPVLLWEWLGGLFRDLGLPPVTSSISFRSAQVAGAAAELLWSILPVRSEPPVTRFLAGALARSHWYDLTPARRDFGYRVRVPMDEATRRTAQWLRETALGATPGPVRA